MRNAKAIAAYKAILEDITGYLAAQKDRKAEDIPEDYLKEQISTWLTRNNVSCELVPDTDELVRHLFYDMRHYSFISREGLLEKQGFEEININAWNDIEIVMDGKRVKTDYSFLDASHAYNILLRMFRKTGTTFNESTPHATADIGDGVRVTAIKTPVVDPDIGVSASIRKVMGIHEITTDSLVQTGTATPFMLDFLLLCLRHGVSICVSGETGAGKTTVSGCLLSQVADTKRIYTIEEGSREWYMRRFDAAGNAVNSVIHTRTMPHGSKPVEQEELVKLALRYDPDIIAPGEIRGKEAFETMAVSNTGHTVLTTVHSNGTLDTPERVTTLAKKAYDMTDATLLSMFARAFPILIHCEKHPDTKRRITEIREVTAFESNLIQSQMLFEFVIEDNVYDTNNPDICTEVRGEFKQINPISERLAQQMLKKGARRAQLAPYLEKEETA